MAAKILQINFKFSVSKDDYRQAAASLASAFAEVEGLRWKIWTIDEAQSMAGGVYLFDDEPSLTRFLESPLADQVRSHPAFTEMSASSFDIVADATTATRGPV
ncbi:MAG: YdhR family protein [candidate division Zixibacteria bacterium]|nr:YdhR family protein [candidate division Zixibacteria bacterium]